MTWIPVADRLPTKDALYLVHCPTAAPESPFIATAWYEPNGYGWSLHPTGYKVTHWMPLPEPPSETSQ